MRYDVLGRLMVKDDAGVPIDVRGPKERVVLAVLLAADGEAVSVDRLVDALWSDRPPTTARRTLASYISRLRRALRADGDPSYSALVRAGGGWLLDVADTDVDARRFVNRAALAAKALADEAFTEAAAHGRAALAEWRGTAFEEFADVVLCAEQARRLEALRLAAEEDTADAEIALGRSVLHDGELLARIEASVSVEPLRERRWAQLMLLHYRAGRQAEALATYARARGTLVEQAGVEPGHQLMALHKAILDQSPALDAPFWHPGLVTLTERESCPFKGLLPYDEGDAGLLFGRERLVGRLVARVAQTRLMCVTGASGSGKSSLLRAGLIAALRAGAVAGSEGWAIRIVNGGRWLLESLTDIVATPPDLLVVDQIEEALAGADGEQRRRLAQLLGSAVAAGCRVVCCLRSDSWAELAAEPEISEALTGDTIVVGPMTDDEIRSMARGAAAVAGLSVDQELVEELVKRVGGEHGALPLLSTVLARTWAYRSDRRLTLEGYHAAGSLEGAIAALAEDAYQELDSEAQQEAAPMLTRLAAAGRADRVIRRHVTLDELLPQGATTGRRAVLDTFLAFRLLVTDDEGVTVTHEALFEHWPRLRGWLEEDRIGRVLRRRLHPAAVEWDHAGRPPADLMRGARLKEVADWSARHPGSLLPIEWAYVEASLQRAESESRRERDVRHRLAALLATTTLLLVVAIIAGLLAHGSAERASEERLQAIADRVGAQALLAPRQDVALLLAAQAVHIHDDAVTRADLLATLLRAPRALRIASLPHRLTSLAVSPDGSTLAVSDNEGEIRLVAAETLRVLSVVRRPTGYPVSAMQFVRGGSALSYGAQAPHGALAVVQSVTTRRTLTRLPGRDTGAVFVSPDGRSVTSAAMDVNYVWLRRRARWVRTALGASRHPTNFTADGSAFAIVGSHGTSLCDAHTGQVLRRLTQIRSPLPGALSPDGRLLATTDPSGTISLWNLRSGSRIARLVGHTETVEALAFDATGSHLISASDDGTVIVWDTANGQRVMQVTAAHQSVSDAQFSPDGSTFYTTAQDGTLARWDLTNRRGFGRTVEGPTGVDSLGLAPHGSMLAAGTDSGRLLLLNPATGKVQQQVTVGAQVTSLAFSPVPDAKVVAVGTAGRGAALVNAPHGLVARHIAAGSLVTGMAWSPDGKRLALTLAEQRAVAVYDAATGRVVARYDPRCRPSSLAWSPDAARLAVSCYGSFVNVLSAYDGSLLHRLTISDDPAVAPSLAFLDGTLLATGGRDGAVRVWDVARGVMEAGPVTATTGVAIGLSPDAAGSGLVAVSGFDGSVSLLDVDSATPTATSLPGPGFALPSAVIDAQRRLLDVYYNDGVLVRWDIDTTRWTTRACAVPGRSLTRAEWRSYLPDLPYDPICGGR